MLDSFAKKQKQFGIGLTGSIACGKSTIGKILADIGFLVIDADQISRLAVQPGSPVLEKIASHFGSDFILEDGNLNRPLMRRHIFENASEKKILESFIHPEMERIYQAQVNNDTTDFAYWFYEASILIELNKQDKFKELWVASCPLEVQTERLMKRDLIDRDLAVKMIGAQMSTAEKIKYANQTISTNLPLDKLKDEIFSLSSDFQVRKK